MYDKETAILLSNKKRAETGKKYVVVDDPKDIMYEVTNKPYVVLALDELEESKRSKVIFVSF